MVPPVNASYLHERLRPRFVTGLPGGSTMSAPFGELATDADVTRILHGRPAALDPFRTLGCLRLSCAFYQGRDCSQEQPRLDAA